MPIPREHKLRLTANVIVPDAQGKPRLFGPDDVDIPDWAKDQPGDHAWGYVAARKVGEVKGKRNAKYADGRPVAISIYCDDGHRRQWVAMFDALGPLEERDAYVDPESGLRTCDQLPPEFDWVWNADLNGKAGPFSATSPVRWRGIGPHAGSVGKLTPRDEDAIVISCGWAGCTQEVRRRWNTARRVLDTLRSQNTPRVSILELNKALRSI